MKKNGFTLVELIITISIFGLMMLVSVPNITSMVDKNKRKVYINDAKKLVKLARYKFYTTYKDVKPAAGTCITYSINSLDMSNLETPPNGGKYYDATNHFTDYSFVKVTYSGNTYIFKVQLVERYTTTTGAVRYRGVPYTENSELDKSNAKAAKVTQTKTDLSGFTSSASGC